MKKFIKIFPLLTLILVFLGSCGVNHQLDLAKALENCKYDIVSADSVTVAGVDINRLKSATPSDLKRMPTLALAFIQQNIPLRGTVNLKITNPTEKDAGINQFEYKLLVKGQELANGFVDQKIMVPSGGGSVTVPINVNANIYSLLADGRSLQAIEKFIRTGSTSGEEVKGTVTIKIKPTLDMGGKQVQYPGYISIDKEISSKILR